MLTTLKHASQRYLVLSENATLLILAISVGVATGGGVWLFRQGITFFQSTFRDGLANTIFHPFGSFAIVLVLALAGLIVGLLVDRFIGEERHHGVAGIMEAVALAGGRLRYQRMPIKAALAAFSLGAGASVGPEDPSVQIGASIGSLLGQRLHLSDERVKLLVAAGAAGGIAAAFRAPIAGVFFALEIILADFSTSSFGVVVLTAVIASVFTQAIDPGGPELGISAYKLGGLQEIPLYVLLGILIAPVAAAFIRMLYWQHDLWHHVNLPRPLKTALAGAIVGVIAMFLPAIMGTGSDTMNLLLNQRGGDLDFPLLIAMALAKIIATTVSLGGGFVGGMFAPSLFMGAALGRAFGLVTTRLFPGVFSADPAAFAIAGMAASMTGVIRAPITAVLLLFELTNDYNLILPIMLTTVVCLFVVERLAPEGIYQLGLARKGIRLARGRDIDLMQTVKVNEVMATDVPKVQSKLPASQLPEEFAKTNTHGLLVTDDNGELEGIVTLQDFSRAQEAGPLDGKTADDISTHDVVTITPDAPISEALALIGSRDLGRLPVVARKNSRDIVGLLRRRDIMRGYDLAVQRRQDRSQHSQEVRLETYSGADVVELTVRPGSPAENRLIREIKWPAGSVVATIHRHGQVTVPHGDTMLKVGDVLTVVTLREHIGQLSDLVFSKAGAQQK